MSLTTLNAWYYGSSGTGGAAIPTKSGQILANAGASQGIAQEYDGFFLITLDGSATTGTVNWIDGTQTFVSVPTSIIAGRMDPGAWAAASYYPVGAVVLGSGHVQQATAAGLSAPVTAPVWKTDGTSIQELGGSTLVWKDMGAIGLSTITPISFTAVTATSATLTISAAGTNTQVVMFPFKVKLGA